MSNITHIFTVETGEWSDKRTHSYCLTLEDAKDNAEAIASQNAKDCDEALEEYADTWARHGRCGTWPCIYRYQVGEMDARGERVRWHSAEVIE